MKQSYFNYSSQLQSVELRSSSIDANSKLPDSLHANSSHTANPSTSATPSGAPPQPQSGTDHTRTRLPRTFIDPAGSSELNSDNKSLHQTSFDTSYHHDSSSDIISRSIGSYSPYSFTLSRHTNNRSQDTFPYNEYRNDNYNYNNIYSRESHGFVDYNSISTNHHYGHPLTLFQTNSFSGYYVNDYISNNNTRSSIHPIQHSTTQLTSFPPHWSFTSPPPPNQQTQQQSMRHSSRLDSPLESRTLRPVSYWCEHMTLEQQAEDYRKLVSRFGFTNRSVSQVSQFS